MNKRTKKKKTIGELTQSRVTWGINASTKVVPNKKGKGSYTRTNNKRSLTAER